MGEAVGTPVPMQAAVGMWAASDPEAPPETWRCYRQILQEGFASIDRRLQEYGPREPERFHLEEANRRLPQREDFLGGGAHDVPRGSRVRPRWRRTAPLWPDRESPSGGVQVD